MALRHTASRAAGTPGSRCRGRVTSPRWTSCRSVSRAASPNGALPVKSVYSVAPRLYTSLAGPRLSRPPTAHQGSAGGGHPRPGVVDSVDARLVAVAVDEANGGGGAPDRIGAEVVERHDAGVLQVAGDLRLQEKAGAGLGVVGVLFLDL